MSLQNVQIYHFSVGMFKIQICISELKMQNINLSCTFHFQSLFFVGQLNLFYKISYMVILAWLEFLLQILLRIDTLRRASNFLFNSSRNRAVRTTVDGSSSASYASIFLITLPHCLSLNFVFFSCRLVSFAFF